MDAQVRVVNLPGGKGLGLISPTGEYLDCLDTGHSAVALPESCFWSRVQKSIYWTRFGATAQIIHPPPRM